MSNNGAISVSRLNQTVRSSIEGDPRLQNIWVEGEVFNYNKHPSGHIYFSLKDETSAIRCTFFKGANLKQRDVQIQNGMRILAGGSVSVYIQRGDYQLNVQRVIPSGEGELRLKIERLKKQLFDEGVFDPARKKEIPFYPVTIGVATAPRGAAIQDIIRVARTRNPYINIILSPCLVQGDGSVESIVSAIQDLNRPELGVDVIIAGRGGGSFEDLLSFNEEAVVRAYASSSVPIVSAVGHEIDHPLSDFAADAYAATPSAAAEMVVPVYADLEEKVNDFEFRLRAGLRSRYRVERDKLDRLVQSRVFQEPGVMLQQRSQTLDFLFRDLRSSMMQKVQQSNRLMVPSLGLEMLYERHVSRLKGKFELADERLRNFSPLATLKRGFSVIRNGQGKVIRKASDAKKGENLEVILERGTLQVEVREIQEKGLLDQHHE